MFSKLQSMKDKLEIINILNFMFNIGLTDLFLHYA